MASRNFIFPPPPPPPPVAGPQSYPINEQWSNQSGHRYNHASSGDNRGNSHGRGRGRRRGDGYGGEGGGYTRGSGYTKPPSGRGGFQGGSMGENNYQTRSFQGSGSSLQNYPQARQSQYPQHGQIGYGHPNPSFSQSQPGPVQHILPQHQNYAGNGYSSGISHGTQASMVTRGGGMSPHNSSYQTPLPNNSQPMVMGPPIRMGFDGKSNPIAPSQQFLITANNHAASPTTIRKPQAQPLLGQDQYVNLQPGRYNKFSQDRGQHNHSQKRAHVEAFGSNRNNYKGQISLPSFAPPCVPSFGIPLPGKPPAPTGAAKNHKRKKRKHNQLGLTPANDNQESSGEEDVDEEAKLAAAHLVSAESAKHKLQFLHHGRLETLKSHAEIAAWIEERKKRFPTKSKAQEAVDRKAKAFEAEKVKKGMRNDELLTQKEEKEKEKKDLDTAAKVESRAEKLQKRLEKTQKQIAKMEARQGMPQTPQPSHTSHNSTEGHTHMDSSGNEGQTEELKSEMMKTQATPSNDNIVDAGTIHQSDSMTDNVAAESLVERQAPLTRLSRQGSPAAEVPDPSGQTKADGLDEMNDSISDISSDTSSDWDTSDSSSDNGQPPTEASSKTQHSAIPAKSQNKKTKSISICRNFLRNGRCPRERNCRYRHELPVRGGASAAKKDGNSKSTHVQEGKKERVSLYQRMLAQDLQKEDELVLQHIIFLGEQGLLDEPVLDEELSVANGPPPERPRDARLVVEVQDVEEGKKDSFPFPTETRSNSTGVVSEVTAPIATTLSADQVPQRKVEVAVEVKPEANSEEESSVSITTVSSVGLDPNTGTTKDEEIMKLLENPLSNQVSESSGVL